MSNGDETDSFNIRLRFNANDASFAASLQVPGSLRSLLRKLPEGAASVLSWLPDITLDAVGIDFTTEKPLTFGVFAKAGIAGSADPAGQAFFASVGDAQNKTAFVAGLAITTPVDFSAVPVLGTLMDGILLDDLAVVYASADLKKNAFHLPPPAPFETPAYKKGISLVLTLESGGTKKSFVLAPKSKPPSKLPTGAVQPLAADDELPPMAWFDVQKSIGPLTFGRIGMSSSEDWLALGLDASLALAGLTISLTGFTAGFPKDDISLSGLSLSLEALGIVFSRGGVLILGNLVRQERAGVRSYDGALLIQTGAYGIAAIGSFAQVEGAVSMFVFGAAQGVFGGPPAFVVTGIAAGFGYNRSLVLPAPEAVKDFPLVLMATMGGSYLPDPKDVAAALAKLSAGGFAPPRLGSYWAAAGLRFSSFQLLDTMALLTVEFGNDLVIALLGVSALTLPKGAGARPFAFAEMTLSAVLRPREGSFKMMALLTPRSFVIDPNCRLTGGFAFYLWFGDNPHAGDFVVTLGGYNPMFVPEEWYPNVPRLGFAWTLSPVLKASGGAYFALTPSAAMAGGALDIRFQEGELRAWFTAHADFIMWWKPFYFIADIGVSIGVSYTIDFGVARKTLGVELAASVLLFGPPIAGTARVKWWVISFEIDINGGGRPRPQPGTLKDWDNFARSFLPVPGADPQFLPAGWRARDEGQNNVVRPLVTGGLLATVDEGTPNEVSLVTIAGLGLGSDMLIPATRAVIEAPDEERAHVFEGPAAGVYPLGQVKLASHHKLTLRQDGAQTPLDLSRWQFAPIVSGVPHAMWALTNSGRPPLAADTMPALLGLRGTPPPPKLSGPEPALLAVLGLTWLERRGLPLPDIAPIDGATGRPEVDPRDAVSETVARDDTIAARAKILAAMTRLGAGRELADDSMALLAEEIRYTFQKPPMLGPLGSTGPKPPQDFAAQPIGTSRAAAFRPSSRRVAIAAPRLRALFRRRYSGVRASLCEAMSWDGFTPAPHRAQLATWRAAPTLAPGETALFDLPPQSCLTLHGNGPVAIDIIGLDQQDELIATCLLRDGEAWEVPGAVTRLVVSGMQPAPVVTGWAGASSLMLLGGHMLLGENFALRTQTILRAGPARATRACGVLSGQHVREANLTLGDAAEGGWTETILSPGGALAVSLVPLPGATMAPAPPAIRLAALPGATLAAAPLQPRAQFTGRAGVDHVYTLGAPPPGPVRIFVTPPPGFAHAGLLAGAALAQGQNPFARRWHTPSSRMAEGARTVLSFT